MPIKHVRKFDSIVFQGLQYSFIGFTRCMKFCALINQHGKIYVPADTLVSVA